MVSSAIGAYFPPLEGGSLGQQHKAVCIGSLLDSPGQQLKRGLLMSTIGVLLMWSLGVKEGTASPDEKEKIIKTLCVCTRAYTCAHLRVCVCVCVCMLFCICIAIQRVSLYVIYLNR